VVTIPKDGEHRRIAALTLVSTTGQDESSCAHEALNLNDVCHCGLHAVGQHYRGALVRSRAS
jgi:hypothetical protein